MKKLILFLLLVINAAAQSVVSTTVPVNTQMVLQGKGTNFPTANLQYFKLANMAELRALSTTLIPNGAGVDVLGYYSAGDGGGGTYTLTNSITGTNAYGGRVLANGGTKSWQLETDGTEYNVLQFGAKPNDGTDDYASIAALISFAGSTPITFPKGRFDFSQTLVSHPDNSGPVGRSCQTFRGVAWTGTSAQTNSPSAEHTTLIGNHTNAIIEYSGIGGAIENFNFVYGSVTTTNDTSRYAINCTGAPYTVFTTFQNLRFYNTYGAIKAELPYQFFNNLIQNIGIFGFAGTALNLETSGTQSKFINIYITSQAPVGAATINSETTTSIVTTGATNCVFTLTSDFATTFAVGMFVSITASDNSAIIGGHTVISVTATSIGVDFASSIGASPTTATLEKVGGAGRPSGYAIFCNEYRDDNWDTLNIEWQRGRGIFFGNRTTVMGLHLEGLQLESGIGGTFVRTRGPLTVTGWDLYNTYTGTNETWYLFGSTTSNAPITLLGGRVRDLYYNPGSTLGLVATSTDLPAGSLLYDNYTTNGTVRFNRTGSFNGTMFANKLVGVNTSDELNLTSLRLTRSLNGTNTLSISGGGFQMRDIAAGRTTFQFPWSAATPTSTLQFGSQTATATPVESVIHGEDASGSNVAAKRIHIFAGKSTGTGTPAPIDFTVGRIAASGSTLQSSVLSASIDANTTTANHSALKIAYYDGANWVTGARVCITNIGGVQYLYIP